MFTILRKYKRVKKKPQVLLASYQKIVQNQIMMFLFLCLSLVSLTLNQPVRRACQIAELVFRSHPVPRVFQSLLPSAAFTVQMQQQNLGLLDQTVGQWLLVGHP